MLRSKRLTIVVATAAILVLLGLSFVFLWDAFPKGAIESRQLETGDEYQNIVLERMKSENPDYLHATNGKVRFVRISARTQDCIWVVADPPIAFNDDDILYCVDKRDGKFLGRL